MDGSHAMDRVMRALLAIALTSAFGATPPSTSPADPAVHETRIADMGAEHGPLAFSPDGRHVACTVHRDDKVCALLDGKAGPLFDEVEEGSFAFSPQTGRLSYRAQKDNCWFAVIDGKTSDLAALAFGAEIVVGERAFELLEMHMRRPAHFAQQLRRGDGNSLAAGA